MEFALVAPVLFLVVLGMIEFGRGFMVQHMLTNAARQGCRSGVIQGRSTADIAATVNKTLQGYGIRGAACIVRVNGGSQDASTARTGDEITVEVTVPVEQISWVPGTHFLTRNLSGRFNLRRE